ANTLPRAYGHAATRQETGEPAASGYHRFTGRTPMAIAEESTASGISFALTDEQSDLRALVHDFAEKEIRPVAAEYDEHQTHPADVIEKAHALGLMNVNIPEELGGPGLSIFDGILIGEEFSWGCAGIAVSLVVNMLGTAPVLLAGTEQQKREWLPPLVEEP